MPDRTNEPPPDNVRSLRPTGDAPQPPAAPPAAVGRSGPLAKALRNEQVIAQLAAGMTESQVGTQLGLSQQAVSGIKRSELAKLAKRTAEDAEDLRALDLVRIEAAIRAIYPQVLRGGLQAVDRLVRLVAQRQKLLGGAQERDAGGDTTNYFVFDGAAVKDLEKATFDFEGTAAAIEAAGELVQEVDRDSAS